MIHYLDEPLSLEEPLEINVKKKKKKAIIKRLDSRWGEPIRAYGEPSLSKILPEQYYLAIKKFKNPDDFSKEELQKFNKEQKELFLQFKGHRGVVKYKPVTFHELIQIFPKKWGDSLPNKKLSEFGKRIIYKRDKNGEFERDGHGFKKPVINYDGSLKRKNIYTEERIRSQERKQEPEFNCTDENGNIIQCKKRRLDEYIRLTPDFEEKYNELINLSLEEAINELASKNLNEPIDLNEFVKGLVTRLIYDLDIPLKEQRLYQQMVNKSIKSWIVNITYKLWGYLKDKQDYANIISRLYEIIHGEVNVQRNPLFTREGLVKSIATSVNNRIRNFSIREQNIIKIYLASLYSDEYGSGLNTIINNELV